MVSLKLTRWRRYELNRGETFFSLTALGFKGTSPGFRMPDTLQKCENRRFIAI